MSAVKLDEPRVAAARLWGATHFPYLATALFASPVVAAPGLGSIAVDRAWRLYIDPDVVLRWSAEEIGSVLVHHVGHLLRDHAGRAEQLGVDDASEAAWVAAADAEINDDLVETDARFPMDPIVPSALGCEAGGFAEDYFRSIRDSEEEHAHAECGSGAHGQHRGWELHADGVPEISPSAAHLLRCKVASEIRSACAGAGKLPGTVSRGWQIWADAVLDPRVDWRRTLGAAVRASFANVAGCVDYSYARPSRRASVMGSVVMPAMRKPLPMVALVIDTSRSMSDLFCDVLAEVDAILSGIGVGRESLRVLSCDAQVHGIQRVTSARQIELYGGGGTSMVAGIESALALRPRASMIVVLTDGYTPWPVTAPKGARVVVGLVGKGRWEAPDWAKVVRIERES
jgi:predicted metal-dependent peptidase